MLSNKHILLTGGAGFIGSHLANALLELGNKVTVIDNFDPFYSKEIKLKNIQSLVQNTNFKFQEMDIREMDQLQTHCNESYDMIVHLAAKAGVRPSIENPLEYQSVNVAGTQNLLEFAKIKKINHFVFASSSSVYGVNPHVPWKESDYVLNPISPYASTKISGELLGHVYSHLYNIRFVALRFFTVFGPRQRPDLAIHLFTKKIMNGEPINMFGDGSTRRDYTYVDDIVSGIIGACTYDEKMFEVFNLGNSQTVTLNEMISTIENTLSKKAIIHQMPEQPGDVPITFSDITKAKEKLNFNPQTSLKEGVEKFVEWLNKNK
ncbi:MAG TPA: GDP-mannose 4,6-dehydratase [Chitinophagaceae bacterium]|mgnify:CR=1 FL=1|nr:MAG: nucleoside-diphosphate-sugar epimerase [Bacteroidetes bacterium OLB11]HMN33295.1 GDP-mannose 4,6-dehydratase [Chitinophagaceae bacterium]